MDVCMDGWRVQVQKLRRSVNDLTVSKNISGGFVVIAGHAGLVLKSFGYQASMLI